MDNEVRRKVGQPPNEIMRDFIDEPLDEKLNDVYTGIVVNNNDPDKQGKCQIRVYGVFGDEVPDSDLPWALPMFSFVGSKVGSFVVPPIGALVSIRFDNGEIYLPFYSSKAVVANRQPSQKDIDYPNNMVFFETDDGEYFAINRKTKVTTYKHSSGTKLEIDKDGNVTILNKIGTSLQYGGNLSSVQPDPVKFGPFCALKFDPVTGIPLQGNTVTRNL